MRHCSNGMSEFSPAEVERRFVLKRAEAESFIQTVAPYLALDVYDQQRPIAYSRTTYLDTADLAYFRSCDGPVSRRVRIREYASAYGFDDPPTLTGLCVLELKEAAGPLRTKARFASPPSVISHIVRYRGESPLLERPPLDQLHALRAVQSCLVTDHLTPRLTTWYRRASLSGEGGRVRVTLDEGIKFCHPCDVGEAGQAAEPVDLIAFGPGRVVEVKHVGPSPDWLSRAIEGLTEANFSKFRVGMEALQRMSADTQQSRSTRPIQIPAHMIVERKE
jgi:hypothetical protein